MVRLGNTTIGETPLFAELSMGRDDLLFEDWQPASSEDFVKEFFPPYVPPEDEADALAATEDVVTVEPDNGASETTAEFKPFLVRPLQGSKAS